MNIKKELQALKISNVIDDDRYVNYVNHIINNILDDFIDEIGHCVDKDHLNNIIIENVGQSKYITYADFHYIILRSYPFYEYQLDLALGDYTTFSDAIEDYAYRSLRMSVTNSKEIQKALEIVSHER